MKDTKTMTAILVLALLFTALPAAALEVQGIVREMTSHEVSIATADGSVRRYSLKPSTSIFSPAGPIVRKVMRNSLVVLALRHGRVEAIFIKEVPK